MLNSEEHHVRESQGLPFSRHLQRVKGSDLLRGRLTCSLACMKPLVQSPVLKQWVEEKQLPWDVLDATIEKKTAD